MTSEPVVELEEPAPESIWPLICDICGDPIFTTTPNPRDDDVNVHFYHEPDCPNYGRFGANIVDCDCEGMAHLECCPECEQIFSRKER